MKNIKEKKGIDTTTKAWKALATLIKEEELDVALELAVLCSPTKDMPTSIVKKEEQQVKELLIDHFKINEDKLEKILQAIMKEGVFARWGVSGKHYIIFNPFLNFNKSEIDESMKRFFWKTTPAVMMRDHYKLVDDHILYE